MVRYKHHDLNQVRVYVREWGLKMVLGYEVQVRIAVKLAKLPDKVLEKLVNVDPDKLNVELVVSRLEIIKSGTLDKKPVLPEDVKKAQQALNEIVRIENARANMNRGRSLSERIEADRTQGSITRDTLNLE